MSLSRLDVQFELVPHTAHVVSGHQRAVDIVDIVDIAGNVNIVDIVCRHLTTCKESGR